MGLRTVDIPTSMLVVAALILCASEDDAAELVGEGTIFTPVAAVEMEGDEEDRGIESLGTSVVCTAAVVVGVTGIGVAAPSELVNT